MIASVSSLIARRVALEWFEGVALAQATCLAVLARDRGPDVRVPNTEQILLTPDGDIELSGDGPSPQSPVAWAASIIETLVPADRMPVQLRLTVVTAASTNPPYASLEEFSKTLEFFERPNRRDLLRAIHARWQASAQAPAAEPEARPAPKAAARSSADRYARRRRIEWGVLAASILLGAGGTWWVATRPAESWVGVRRQHWGSTAASTANAIGTAAANGFGAIKEKLGIGQAPPAEPATEAVAQAAPPSPGGRPRAGAAPASRPGARQGRARSAANPAGNAGGSPANEGVPAAGPTAHDMTVYTPESPGVTPPTAVSAKMPTRTAAGTEPTEYQVFELTVSETGEVESVKLLSAAESVRATMMLSALKAWRFRPATRDGRAVRYRYTLKAPVS